MPNETAAHRPGCAGSVAGSPLDKLAELVAQRLALAQDVAAVKYASGRPIDDPAREREVLGSVARALNARGLYQRIGMGFFRDQIEASKVIQRGLYHRWYAHPDEVPEARGDLAAEVRPKLASITGHIIRQLGCLDEMPRLRQEDVADLVDKRILTTLAGRQLPRLHWNAALFAMRSFSEAVR